MPSLTTVHHLKDWLGITDVSQDTFLTTLLNRAEAMLEGWCNRPDGWVSASFTERFDGEMSPKVVLVNNPVTAVASVKVYTSNTATITLDSSVYRLDSATGILSFIDAPSALWDAGQGDWPIAKRAFGHGFRNGEVVYTGGYATSAIPVDLQQLAIETAGLLYQNRGANPAMKSETLGQYTYTRQDVGADLFVSVKEQLEALGYVRRAVL